VNTARGRRIDDVAPNGRSSELHPERTIHPEALEAESPGGAAVEVVSRSEFHLAPRTPESLGMVRSVAFRAGGLAHEVRTRPDASSVPNESEEDSGTAFATLAPILLAYKPPPHLLLRFAAAGDGKLLGTKKVREACSVFHRSGKASRVFWHPTAANGGEAYRPGRRGRSLSLIHISEPTRPY